MVSNISASMLILLPMTTWNIVSLSIPVSNWAYFFDRYNAQEFIQYTLPPYCMAVAVLRLKNTAEVLRHVWNPVSMRVVKVWIWSVELRPTRKPAWYFGISSFTSSLIPSRISLSNSLFTESLGIALQLRTLHLILLSVHLGQWPHWSLLTPACGTCCEEPRFPYSCSAVSISVVQLQVGCLIRNLYNVSAICSLKSADSKVLSVDPLLTMDSSVQDPGIAHSQVQKVVE